ncbi:MAG TPA: DMT family transporter [Candidatus Hydrogenedentes bacterium]|nr:DMT family transporter [Candidatus Hydrogenedentota bacterium]HPG65245.1 DMT family transporter [Candidatus Hydrogenedentota bacterium]
MLLILVTMVMWAATPLFVRHFASYYDVWTQNAFRYIFAASILLVLGRLGVIPPYRLNRSQWVKLALVTAPNALMQTTFAGMYYFIYPAVGSLVSRVNIIFVTVLSFLIFHDERRVIRSPRFLIGATLAFVGVCSVIIGRDPELLARLNVSDNDFWIGIGICVANALFGSLYALTIKHAVRDIPPLVCYRHVSWMTAIVLCIPLIFAGGVSDLWRQPVLPLALMAATAILSLVVAHTCYYAALREIKAVISSSIMQLTPVVACLLSALVYGDHLAPLQLVGGAAVIGGAWLAALAQAKPE